MRLNPIEFILINNPVRAAVQRHVEARRLLRMGGPVPGARALEIGCGRGVGATLILEVFEAATVHAFDLDHRMVVRARRRAGGRPSGARVWVGDATAIAVPDASYDAVFDFGILHHVPDWPRGLAEVHRVLRPGGRFYAEEVLRRVVVHPVVRRLVSHPQHNRFDAARFVAALREVGLSPLKSEGVLNSFGWFVASKPGASAD